MELSCIHNLIIESETNPFVGSKARHRPLDYTNILLLRSDAAHDKKIQPDVNRLAPAAVEPIELLEAGVS